MLHFLPEISLMVASLDISAPLLPILRLPPTVLQMIWWAVASVSASPLALATSHICEPMTSKLLGFPTSAITHDDSLPSMPIMAKPLSGGASLSSILVPIHVSSPLSSAVLILDEASLQFVGLSNLHSSSVLTILDLPTVPLAPSLIEPVVLPPLHSTSLVTPATVALSIEVPSVPSTLSEAGSPLEFSSCSPSTQ